MFDIICREAVLKGCCCCCIGILASIYCSRSSETASVFPPWGHILGEAEYSESYGKEREIRARALLQYTRGLGFWINPVLDKNKQDARSLSLTILSLALFAMQL
jgi:hypothetical protein